MSGKIHPLHQFDSRPHRSAGSGIDTGGLAADDNVIWQLFKGGDLQAYEVLYRKYAPILYDYGYKLSRDQLLVEDVIQELFIQLLQKKERLIQPDNVKYYLLKSVRNAVLKSMQSRHKHFRTADIFLQRLSLRPQEEFDNQEEERQYKEQTTQLLEEVNKLPGRQKELIFLRFYHGCTYAQAARIMNIDQRSVYKMMYKALANLKRNLVESSLLVLLTAVY